MYMSPDLECEMDEGLDDNAEWTYNFVKQWDISKVEAKRHGRDYFKSG